MNESSVGIGRPKWILISISLRESRCFEDSFLFGGEISRFRDHQTAVLFRFFRRRHSDERVFVVVVFHAAAAAATTFLAEVVQKSVSMITPASLRTEQLPRR